MISDERTVWTRTKQKSTRAPSRVTNAPVATPNVATGFIQKPKYRHDRIELKRHASAKAWTSMLLPTAPSHTTSGESEGGAPHGRAGAVAPFPIPQKRREIAQETTGRIRPAWARVHRV